MPIPARRPQRSLRLPVILVIAVLLYTGAVNAAPLFELQAATFTAQIHGGAGGGSILTPDSSLPSDIALDYVLDSGAHFSGRALTTGGASPAADVQVSTLGTNGSAQAWVQWQAYVTGGSEARIVPLIFTLIGEASQTGDARAFAESNVAELGRRGTWLVRGRADAFRGTPTDGYSHIVTVPFYIDANGQGFEFEAIADVGTLFSHASSAQAIADPGISIDPLWEFAHEYTISYSTNLFPGTSTVDAPQSLAMMTFALLALSVRSRRRRTRQIAV